MTETSQFSVVVGKNYIGNNYQIVAYEVYFQINLKFVDARYISQNIKLQKETKVSLYNYIKISM